MTKLAYSIFIGFLLGMMLILKPVMGQEVEKVSNFSLKNGNGDTVSLKDFAGKKAVAIVFTSSHCSWSTKYEERLNNLYNSYKDKGLAIIAINSNDPTMSERDESKTMRKILSFPFPYVKDGDQQVAKLLGATKNPEAILLVPKDSVFKIVYRGKIDDNPLDASMVKSNFLTSAIDSVLIGKNPAVNHTPVTGCNIKWIEQ